MANLEHLKILERGINEWNKWRSMQHELMPDLRGATLNDADLGGVNLGGAHLILASLSGADLSLANLSGANLSDANLGGANLNRANLSCTALREAYLGGADLSNTDLSDADLSGADLSGINLRSARLGGADFTNSYMGLSSFGDNDFSQVRGLETVLHYAPSTIGIDTLYKSAGKISDAFLHGCGVPDDFITFIPSHFGIQQAIQFYSCFISYSTEDEKFARRLYSRMRDEKLRVWFAPEDVKSGEKLYEQIERAIQIHDRLLIVLSESSLRSKWVMTEIRRARKVELRENRRKLFPIRLVNFDALQSWECFDADTGEDLAAEVRQYFIPDFSNWKEHEAFERAFDRLLRDLRAEEKEA